MRIYGAGAGARYAAKRTGSSNGCPATTPRPKRQVQGSVQPTGLAMPRPTRRRRRRPRRLTSARSCCRGGPTTRRRPKLCGGLLPSRRWHTSRAVLGGETARLRRAVSGRHRRGHAAKFAAGPRLAGPPRSSSGGSGRACSGRPTMGRPCRRAAGSGSRGCGTGRAGGGGGTSCPGGSGSGGSTGRRAAWACCCLCVAGGPRVPRGPPFAARSQAGRA